MVQSVSGIAFTYSNRGENAQNPASCNAIASQGQRIHTTADDVAGHNTHRAAVERPLP